MKPSDHPSQATRLHQAQGGQQVERGQPSSFWHHPTEPDPRDGWQWLTDLCWVIAIWSVLFAIGGGLAGFVYGLLNR